MSCKICPADDNDIREIIRIMFKAYGGKNEYINAIYPRSLTEEGLEISIQRLLLFKSSVKGVIWEKVIDTVTDKIVGGAMWLMYTETKPQRFPTDGPPGTWLTDEEKEYAQELNRTIADDEYAYWVGKELPFLRTYSCDTMGRKNINSMAGLIIMTVDPDFQRRGAGAALLKSGLDLADKERAPVCIANSVNFNL